MDDKVVSIIVPVYNNIDFLPSLAQVARALPGDALEILLVDDGSLDGSSMFCDEIAASDPRFKVIHKTNGGVSSARNAGIASAVGKYICFWDADDSVRPDMYQRLIASAESYNSDIVMGGYEKVDGSHTTPIAIPFDEVITSQQQVKTVAWSMAFWNGFLDGTYLPSVYGSVWPNLYRREILTTHNICFPENIVIGEDLLFNLKYLSYVKTLSVVNEPLYKYNIANASATRKQNDKLWQRYCQLLNAEKQLLTDIYGSSSELSYNLHRQQINYAINVGEEQLCVFLDARAARQAIKNLCNDMMLQESASYIIAHGKNLKERLQAALIRGKCVELIRLWLS